LFKERDEFADSKGDVTVELPLSVATGRDVSAIAKSAGRVWGPDGDVKISKARKSSAPNSPAAKKTAGRAKTAGRPGTAAIRRSNAASQSKREVAGVELSHQDRILYPENGITKLDLALYYQRVADWMLPLVAHRLISLVRCPAGSQRKCFFQKHPGEGAFESLRRYQVREKAGTEEYLVVDSAADLVSLVQMSVLEIHVWGSRADQIDKPDRLVFDLDPHEDVAWPRVVAAAKEVRLLLRELELESFLKTTGGKGLHVVVPIQRRTSWEDAKAFCRAVAELMVAAAPDRYIATMSKAARKGKIFVDYLRNDRGATSIAPYSTRARKGATVSTPIAWEELTGHLRSDHFTIENVPARLAKLKKDPWSGLATVRQSITAAMLRRLKRF
jgi:bifunctional non-homologous end joining protein LigD